MRPIQRLRDVARESWTSAWAAPVSTLLTMAMVAGMCAAVLLTSGRTVGAQQAVLTTIESSSSRAIAVRVDPTAGLRPDVLARVNRLGGVEWAGAFGSATDVRNGAFDGAGTPVALRLAWSDDWTALGVEEPGAGDVAVASVAALEQLGITGGAGSALTADGVAYAIVGPMDVPGQLQGMEPLLLAPQPTEGSEGSSITLLVVVATTAAGVAPLAAAVPGVLGVADPSKVAVSTSPDLTSLRDLVAGQLGAFGRGLTLAVLGLSAVLVAVIGCGVVMMRRKDFGRRRALGASQSLIVGLLLAQTAWCAVLGAGAGSAAALLTLAVSGDPLPGWTYTTGLAILATATAVAAGVLPALIAARRQPIVELRVP